VICFKSYESHYAIYFKLFEFAILFFAIFALSGQIWRAINVASIIIILVYYAAKIYWHFYRRHLFIADVMTMLNPDNFGTVLRYKELIGLIILLFVVVIFAIFAHSKSAKFSVKFRFLSTLLFSLSLGGFLYFATLNSTKLHWYRQCLPSSKDAHMNLLMSMLNNMKLEVPTFDNTYPYFEKKAQEIAPYKTSNLKPNLILWLQESTIDTKIYRGLGELSMFLDAPNLKYKSYVRVHTFGGGTIKSEFEILSGISPDNFGVNSFKVFSDWAGMLKFSLPNLLKKEGYRTIIINPLNLDFYGGRKAYKELGFDEFYHPQDFGYKGEGGSNAKDNKNLWTIPSQNFADYTKQIFEKYPDEPLLIYVLTMFEHGPYDRAKEIKFGLEKEYKHKTALALSDYYSRIIELNKAVENLDEYLMQSKRPYVFGYFGDHQGLVGIDESDVGLNFTNPLFITQFFVRGSDDIEKIAFDDTKLGELGLGSSVILELMQIKPNEFFGANYAMRKLCGAIDDCNDQDLSRSFRSFMFDKLGAIELKKSEN